MSVFAAHVWRKGVLPLVAFLALTFVSLAAMAQEHPYQASPNCLTVLERDREIDGNHYAVITFSKDAENCELRNAYKLFPLEKDGKRLTMQEWMNQTYHANRKIAESTKRLSMVGKGCVITYDRKPPSFALEEEKGAGWCPNGVMNYYAVPSNGWKAPVYIPLQFKKSEFAVQKDAAKAACPEAKSAEAIKACKEAGFATGTESAKTDQPPAQPTPPKQDLTPAQAVELEMLRTENAAARSKMAKLEQQLKAEMDWATFVEVFSASLFAFLVFVIVWQARRHAATKKQLQTERRANTLPPGGLQRRFENLKKDSVEELANRIEENKRLQANLERANSQLATATGERDKAVKAIEEKKGEIASLREELRSRNLQLETLKRSSLPDSEKIDAMRTEMQQDFEERIIEQANQLGESHKAELERQAAQAADVLKKVQLKASSDVAEKDAAIGKLRRRIEELEGVQSGLRKEIAKLQEELKAANDNAVKTQTSTENKQTSTENSQAAVEPPSGGIEKNVSDLIKVVVVNEVHALLAQLLNQQLREIALNEKRARIVKAAETFSTEPNKIRLQNSLDTADRLLAKNAEEKTATEAKLRAIGAERLALHKSDGVSQSFIQELNARMVSLESQAAANRLMAEGNAAKGAFWDEAMQNIVQKLGDNYGVLEGLDPYEQIFQILDMIDTLKCSKKQADNAHKEEIARLCVQLEDLQANLEQALEKEHSLNLLVSDLTTGDTEKVLVGARQELDREREKSKAVALQLEQSGAVVIDLTAQIELVRLDRERLRLINVSLQRALELKVSGSDCGGGGQSGSTPTTEPAPQGQDDPPVSVGTQEVFDRLAAQRLAGALTVPTVPPDTADAAGLYDAVTKKHPTLPVREVGEDGGRPSMPYVKTEGSPYPQTLFPNPSIPPSDTDKGG